MKIRNITTEQPEFLDIKKWYEQNLHPDANNYDDQKTFDVYKGEAFPGIFQLTSKGAQRLFRQAEPKSIVDIAVLTAIYRPGPLAANVDKIYLKAKKGEKFEWGHPLFEKVLGETYNCLTGDTLILLANLQQKSLSDIEIGDEIISFNEKTQHYEQDIVKAKVCNGTQDLIMIETETGTLKCTPEHKIMTKRGWVCAGDLMEDDEIVSYEI